MERENLKAARRLAGRTQQFMADHLHVSLRYYKKLESGEALGSIAIWDNLEDMFCLSQRYLREICLDKEGNQ